ncbi:hypothetical protein ACFR9U_06390 [Halorientalis brevis]|uniref:Uncharacterized protein n=1 Tax=Halorientalis brevis TaxID=1126241 RepID=A0ABD6C9S1_9EURY|nr:hypothetical protein [Halorientalis brevis]
MQVFCTDGTVFACRSYDLTEYGVKLYGQHPDADERYRDDPEQIGFVPHDRLGYILPDGVRPASQSVVGAQPVMGSGYPPGPAGGVR